MRGVWRWLPVVMAFGVSSCGGLPVTPPARPPPPAAASVPEPEPGLPLRPDEQWRCQAIVYEERPTCPPGAPCHHASPPTTRDWWRFSGGLASDRPTAEASARRRVAEENDARRELFERAMAAYPKATSLKERTDPGQQPRLRSLHVHDLQCQHAPLGEALKGPAEGRIHAPRDQVHRDRPAGPPTGPHRP